MDDAAIKTGFFINDVTGLFFIDRELFLTPRYIFNSKILNWYDLFHIIKTIIKLLNSVCVKISPFPLLRSLSKSLFNITYITTYYRQSWLDLTDLNNTHT